MNMYEAFLNNIDIHSLHAVYFLSADLFQNQPFFKKCFMNIIYRVSHSLDPDQVRRFVGPDLVPNCLQMLSADDNSRQLELRKRMSKYEIAVVENQFLYPKA